MKSSIKPGSCERTVTGLVFWPEEKPERFFPSVHAWAEANFPDKATIYDTVDAHRSCGVPICDATLFRGLWQRLPTLLPTHKAKIRVHPAMVSVMVPPVKAKLKTVPGIYSADPKDSHKMHY